MGMGSYNGKRDCKKELSELYACIVRNGTNWTLNGDLDDASRLEMLRETFAWWFDMAFLKSRTFRRFTTRSISWQPTLEPIECSRVEFLRHRSCFLGIV
jgi:hypothetical protein